jgi:hypothetical protein
VIGLFFALIIKAATSRQREFLADASAVEFTRNPDGLGGALKVIAGHKMGSRVRCAKALEASHLFFAKGCGGLAGWLDSHPPLDERIRRIDPSWDGVPQFDHARDLHAYEGAFQETMNLVSTQQPVPEERITPIDSTDVCEGRQLGIIDPRAEWDAAHAEALRTTVSGLLLELAEDVDAAPIVLYGLWLSADRDDASNAGSHLDLLDEEARIPTKAILSHLSGVEAGPRMILFDLAVKALDSISSTELRRFAENARRLAGATSGESFFHWVWDRMATSVVRARSGEPPAKPRFGSLDRLLGPCELLLSVLAHAGGRGPLTCYSFQRAASQLGYELALRPLDHCTLKNLDLALAVLEQVSLACRRRILLACAACISSDQAIAETEAYLIRGICVALGFPAPALLPGQPVAPGS